MAIGHNELEAAKTHSQCSLQSTISIVAPQSPDRICEEGNHRPAFSWHVGQTKLLSSTAGAVRDTLCALWIYSLERYGKIVVKHCEASRSIVKRARARCKRSRTCCRTLARSWISLSDAEPLSTSFANTGLYQCLKLNYDIHTYIYAYVYIICICVYNMYIYRERDIDIDIYIMFWEIVYNISMFASINIGSFQPAAIQSKGQGLAAWYWPAVTWHLGWNASRDRIHLAGLFKYMIKSGLQGPAGALQSHGRRKEKMQSILGHRNIWQNFQDLRLAVWVSCSGNDVKTVPCWRLALCNPDAL